MNLRFFVPLQRLSADDEDSGPLFPHRRKALDHHVVHQAIFILLLVLSPLVSFRLPTGWHLLGEPLLLHRLRQLIGQLLHRHLEEKEEIHKKAENFKVWT